MLSVVALALFRHFAGVAIALAIFVMFKTSYDEINARDCTFVRCLRYFGFTYMAITLAFAIWEDGSQLSLLLLFYSGVLSLAINALALQLRK